MTNPDTGAIRANIQDQLDDVRRLLERADIAPTATDRAYLLGIAAGVHRALGAIATLLDTDELPSFDEMRDESMVLGFSMSHSTRTEGSSNR